MRVAPLTVFTAVAAPLIRPNVDTDAIIPSREIKAVSKRGLADGLFAGWRYTQVGGREPDPGFVLNDPAYAGARILLGGENFGCGSSREHAAWALAEYGFRVVIAPSFNPIFQNNCVRNGIAPAPAPIAWIEDQVRAMAPNPQALRLTLDLDAQTLTGPFGSVERFAIGEEAKAMLLNGLDAIDLTFTRRSDIEAFHEADRRRRPWAYL